jgi:predicted DNA-binding protein
VNMTKTQKQRRLVRDRCAMKFRLPPPLYQQLKRLAEREDRTMTYLARRFIQDGLEAEVRSR